MRQNLNTVSISLLLAFAAVSCRDDAPSVAPSGTGDRSVQASAPASPAALPFRVPVESEIRDTVTLASTRRGRALIHSTRDSLPHNVGANLSCANCHVGDGTQANAMPLVGAYTRFPQFRARSGHVDLLEDRINDCFKRSMNGKALSADSRDMRDIVTYIAFLSRGYPPGSELKGQGVPKLEPLEGDTARGRQIFATTCVACHGADGNGSVAAPPLWGPRSYNIGAGMARVRSAAAFIHQVMPRDKPGTLTPQQAFDVATYINTRSRPDFPGKENDWPHGGTPPDVAYSTLASRKAANSATR
ncbi:MAG: c-type cytochrome [Gemmatimonadales bacterium]